MAFSGSERAKKTERGRHYRLLLPSFFSIDGDGDAEKIKKAKLDQRDVRSSFFFLQSYNAHLRKIKEYAIRRERGVRLNGMM